MRGLCGLAWCGQIGARLLRHNKNKKEKTMEYAIQRHDGAIFPERYESLRAAQDELSHKLGNGAGHGLARIVQIEGEESMPPLVEAAQKLIGLETGFSIYSDGERIHIATAGKTVATVRTEAEGRAWLAAHNVEKS